MSQILIGLVIGISTSIIAGIILIWKGNWIVDKLKFLPIKFPNLIKTNFLAYLYVNALSRGSAAYDIPLIKILLAGFLLIFGFLLFLSSKDLTDLLIGKIDLPSFFKTWSFSPSSPDPVIAKNYASLFVVIPSFLLTFLSIVIAWNTIILYLIRNIERKFLIIKDCTLRCGTEIQVKKYLLAASMVNCKKDVIDLMIYANRIIGHFALADEIIESLNGPDNNSQSISAS